MPPNNGHDVPNVPKVQFPTMYDLLMAAKNDVMGSLRVCLPATITAVDTDAGTVDVQIDIMQRDSSGLAYSYPPISGCPVITMQGGGIVLGLPIAEGDKCLLFFADRCMDAWKQSGEPSPLPNLRMHDLSDGFALVGVNSLSNLLETCLEEGEGGIASEAAKVAINKETGLITVATQTKNLATTLATLVTTLTTLNTALGSMTTGSIAAGTTQATIAALTAQLVTVNADLAEILY